jgi:hypothetical protein
VHTRYNIFLFLYVGFIVVLAVLFVGFSWVAYTCDPRFDPGPPCVFDALLNHDDSARDNTRVDAAALPHQ